MRAARTPGQAQWLAFHSSRRFTPSLPTARRDDDGRHSRRRAEPREPTLRGPTPRRAARVVRQGRARARRPAGSALEPRWSRGASASSASTSSPSTTRSPSVAVTPPRVPARRGVCARPAVVVEPARVELRARRQAARRRAAPPALGRPARGAIAPAGPRTDRPVELPIMRQALTSDGAAHDKRQTRRRCSPRRRHHVSIANCAARPARGYASRF